MLILLINLFVPSLGLAQTGTEGGVAINPNHLYYRFAQHQGPVQAEPDRSWLGDHSTITYDGRVHCNFQRVGQGPHRRHRLSFVLSVRTGSLVILRSRT